MANYSRHVKGISLNCHRPIHGTPFQVFVELTDEEVILSLVLQQCQTVALPLSRKSRPLLKLATVPLLSFPEVELLSGYWPDDGAPP